jgi:branched-chain amino acid transport system permease protein
MHIMASASGIGHVATVGLISGITLGCFYGILAIGMQAVFRSSRVLNFGQGDFAVVGAFVYITLLNLAPGIGPWVALVITVLLGAVVGVVFQEICVRPLLGRATLHISLGTFAGSILIEGILLQCYGAQTRVVAPLPGGAHQFHVFGAVVQVQQLYMLGFALVALLILQTVFRKTWLGLSMRSMAENTTGGLIVGMSSRRTRATGFAIGGGIGALAGVVIAPLVGVSFIGGASYVLPAFAAALFGGFSSTLATFLGGIILGVITAVVDATVGAQYESIGIFAALLLLMIVRPLGMFGESKV